MNSNSGACLSGQGKVCTSNTFQPISVDIKAMLNAFTKFYYTVKWSRREVSFDSQNGKYASQLSCDASPEAYL
jgi:hypothetical protein